MNYQWTYQITIASVSLRRFSTESYEKGDISWRPCSSIRDQDLLHSISSTDGGLRIKAMHVICRLLSYDWRLGHITCYHVQTALLHDMDFHVDFSPRWQRNTLDSCVRSLLKTLLYFVDRESLPHFELNQLNLWDDMSPRQLSLARGALTRLLTNENALVSLVRRSLNGCTASVDMGLLNIFWLVCVYYAVSVVILCWCINAWSIVPSLDPKNFIGVVRVLCMQ